MDLTMFTEMLSNVAFPMLVAGYLLLRFEQKLDNLEMSIQELTAAIQLLENKKC